MKNIPTERYMPCIWFPNGKMHVLIRQEKKWTTLLFLLIQEDQIRDLAAFLQITQANPWPPTTLFHEVK